MDSLTHGLFGLAIAALRRPDALGHPERPGAASPTDRAVLVACVLAAELPDLDYLLPASDPVMSTLRAHRGPSHALLAAPLVALVAAGLTKLLFRRARFAPVALQASLAVLLAHLLPDLWTGWGTRILLPFSAERLHLDWTGVVDPLVTLPLAIAALLAWRRRRFDWRRPLLVGLAVTAGYLGLRIGLQQAATARVRAAYPAAEVHVFPATLGVLRWRFVAEEPHERVAGVVDVGGDVREQGRSARNPQAAVGLERAPVVGEVLAWARFPVIDATSAADGSRRIAVGDLRYHLEGEPTLRFVVELDPHGAVTSARLDRGGAPRDIAARMLRDWRK